MNTEFQDWESRQTQKHADEHKRIIKQKTEFYKAVVAEMKALGADVESDDTDENVMVGSSPGFRVNGRWFSGVHEGFVVTPIAAKGRTYSNFSRAGDWSGAFSVTLFRGFSNGRLLSTTWRSKKNGVLPVEAIAAAVVKAADEMNAREKTSDEHATARLVLRESGAFKALQKLMSGTRASIDVNSNGKTVVLKFDALTLPQASALMDAFLKG